MGDSPDTSSPPPGDENIWNSVSAIIDEIRALSDGYFRHEPEQPLSDADKQAAKERIRMLNRRLVELGQPAPTEEETKYFEYLFSDHKARTPVLKDLFTGEEGYAPPESDAAGSGGPTHDPNLDTGHYDDAHSFGWRQKPEPKADGPAKSQEQDSSAADVPDDVPAEFRDIWDNLDALKDKREELLFHRDVSDDPEVQKWLEENERNIRRIDERLYELGEPVSDEDGPTETEPEAPQSGPTSTPDIVDQVQPRSDQPGAETKPESEVPEEYKEIWNSVAGLLEKRSGLQKRLTELHTSTLLHPDYVRVNEEMAREDLDLVETRLQELGYKTSDDAAQPELPKTETPKTETPQTELPETEAPKSGVGKKVALIAGVVVVIGAATGISLAAFNGGGKTTIGASSAPSVGESAPPAPAPSANPSVAPLGPQGPTFYVPQTFDIVSSTLGGQPFTANATSWTADVKAVEEPPLVRSAFQRDGFLLAGQGSLIRTGVSGDEKSWPDGSSVILRWNVVYFQTNRGAVEAEHIAAPNIFQHPTTLPGLSQLGVTASQVSITGGITDQSWVAVVGNAFIVVGDAGRYRAGTVQQPQISLLAEIKAFFREQQGTTGTSYTKDQAGHAYLAAVAPVNQVEPAFWGPARKWKNSITNAQAQSEAAPLLDAFQAVQPELLNIAAAYPRAAAALEADAAAASVLQYDLTELSELNRIGVQPWLARYAQHIATLIAKSNRAREALGLTRIGY